MLDCLVTRHNNELRTTIYRKPTHTDRLLDQSSYNPTSHKATTIRTLTKRAQLVCDSPDSLRGSDCKYRESADKLRKSKILITCQKNTFGELSSKILLKPSGILLFSGNSEKRFCLIYYAIIRLKIKQIENACFQTVCNARKQF